MTRCSVCSCILVDGMLCPACKYDSSLDYELYPTLVQVKPRTGSASGIIKERNKIIDQHYKDMTFVDVSGSTEYKATLNTEHIKMLTDKEKAFESMQNMISLLKQMHTYSVEELELARSKVRFASIESQSKLLYDESLAYREKLRDSLQNSILSLQQVLSYSLKFESQNRLHYDGLYSGYIAGKFHHFRFYKDGTVKVMQTSREKYVTLSYIDCLYDFSGSYEIKEQRIKISLKQSNRSSASATIPI